MGFQSTGPDWKSSKVTLAPTPKLCFWIHSDLREHMEFEETLQYKMVKVLSPKKKKSLIMVCTMERYKESLKKLLKEEKHLDFLTLRRK